MNNETKNGINPNSDEQNKVVSADNMDPAVISSEKAEQNSVYPNPQTPDSFGSQSYSSAENGFGQYSYYPEAGELKTKKKKKKKNILTAVVAVLCVLAIGVTSVVGYTLISGDGLDISKYTSGSESAKNDNDKNSADNASNRDTSNLPTLEQLATPSDALSIPDIVKKVSDSIVGISAVSSSATSTGTGIIMSEDGYIITNAHVVSGASSISVVFTKKEETLKAELVGIDSQTDIAVVKIDKTGLTAAEFGTSADLQVGELAIAIGNPLGFALAGSVTSGIISATDRTLTIEDQEMDLIQTDASINSGSSGGALVNAYGQVIGITSSKVNSSYGEGLGFAIPIDNATPIINDLIKYGYVKGRPVLGIAGETITELYSQYYNIPQGFIVRSVEKDSAADKAGIEVGDIVVGINDTTITSVTEFNKVKSKCKAGDTITITLYRNNVRKEVKATLDEDTSAATSNETTEESQSQTQGYGYDYDYGYGFGNGFGSSYSFDEESGTSF